MDKYKGFLVPDIDMSYKLTIAYVEASNCLLRNSLNWPEMINCAGIPSCTDCVLWSKKLNVGIEYMISAGYISKVEALDSTLSKEGKISTLDF